MRLESSFCCVQPFLWQDVRSRFTRAFMSAKVARNIKNGCCKRWPKCSPKDCVPILVADAGFRRPWIKAVEAQGWYYVGRVRNRDLYRNDAQIWLPVKTPYALASSSPKSLGRIEMTQSVPHFIHWYCIRHSAKGLQTHVQRLKAKRSAAPTSSRAILEDTTT